MLTNPYEKDLKNGRCTTITTRVNEADYNLIKCTRPGIGTITGVIGTLWFKMSEELRKRNLTDVSMREEFEKFINECRIVSKEEYDKYIGPTNGRSGGLFNGTSCGAVSETTPSNHVTGGTPSTSDVNSTVAPESANVPSRSGKRSKGRRSPQTEEESGKSHIGGV